MFDSAFTPTVKLTSRLAHFGEMISGLFRSRAAKQYAAAFEVLIQARRERDWAKQAFDLAKKRSDTRMMGYWSKILDTRVLALLRAEAAAKAVSQ